MFKRRRFPIEIILVCLRWYCKYGISYRHLTEMMQERGVEVDPSTIMRWVMRPSSRSACGLTRATARIPAQSRRMARWAADAKYLFRAVDKHGRLIDFTLLERRNTRAAHRFLSKAVITVQNWPPTSITTDKLPSYPEAIARLKRDGPLSNDTRHRASKYLNNISEADHGALKRMIRPTRGF